MSSLSKASLGALEALKAIRPFLTFAKHDDEFDLGRTRKLSEEITTVGSDEGELYHNGLARTLRSAASYFYISNYEDSIDIEAAHKIHALPPKRRTSTASMRGLFRRKSIGLFSHVPEDEHIDANCKDSSLSIRSRLNQQSKAPQLQVDIPRSSLRERAGGLTSKSVTNLIDPSEFETETSERDSEAGADVPNIRSPLNVTFDPRLHPEPYAAAPITISDIEPSLIVSPTNSRKASKFPVRSRLSMKKSLDRIHAKVHQMLSPTPRFSDQGQPASPHDEDTDFSDSSPSRPDMGSRDKWQSIREDRERRYQAAMENAPSTESDDCTDFDLELTRLDIVSPFKEKNCDASDTLEENDSLVSQNSLRFAVEANKRNCGPVLDNLDYDMGIESGPGLLDPVKGSHFSSHTTLVNLPQSSPELKTSVSSQDRGTEENSRGRRFDRNSSARRSISLVTPTRVSPIKPEKMDALPLADGEDVFPSTTGTDASSPYENVLRGLSLRDGTEELHDDQAHHEENSAVAAALAHLNHRGLCDHPKEIQAALGLHEADAWPTRLNEDDLAATEKVSAIDDSITISSHETDAWTTTSNSEDHSTTGMASIRDNSVRSVSGPDYEALHPTCTADFLADFGGLELDIHDPSKPAYIHYRDLTEDESFERYYWDQTWRLRAELQQFHITNGLHEPLDFWDPLKLHFYLPHPTIPYAQIDKPDAITPLGKQAQSIWIRFNEVRVQLSYWYVRRTFGILDACFDWPDEDEMDDVLEYNLQHDHDNEEMDDEAEVMDCGCGYDGQEFRDGEEPGEKTTVATTETFPETSEHDDDFGSCVETDASMRFLQADQVAKQSDDRQEVSPLVTNRYVQELFDFTKLAEQESLSSESSSDENRSVANEAW